MFDEGRSTAFYLLACKIVRWCEIEHCHYSHGSVHMYLESANTVRLDSSGQLDENFDRSSPIVRSSRSLPPLPVHNSQVKPVVANDSLLNKVDFDDRSECDSLSPTSRTGAGDIRYQTDSTTLHSKPNLQNASSSALPFSESDIPSDHDLLISFLRRLSKILFAVVCLLLSFFFSSDTYVSYNFIGFCSMLFNLQL